MYLECGEIGFVSLTRIQKQMHATSCNVRNISDLISHLSAAGPHTSIFFSHDASYASSNPVLIFFSGGICNGSTNTMIYQEKMIVVAAG